MNKLSRLFLRRLERIARREAQRNAHLNGLLSLKIVEVGGHVLRRYSPASETASLSGDHDRDVTWVRRNFGGYLLPPPQQSDTVTTEGKSPTSFLPSLYRLGQVTANDHVAAIDHKRRAYAVGLVGRAGRAPLVGNIVAALVLARAIENGRVPLVRIVRAAAMSAPVVALHAPVAGFEQAMRRLIETPGFVPGGALSGIDGEYVYHDGTFAGSEGAGRAYIQFLGHSIARITRAMLRRRLANATTRDYTFGSFLEEKHKPAFYDAAVSYVHPPLGLFPHINPGEYFVWGGVLVALLELEKSGAVATGFHIQMAIWYAIVGLVVILLKGILTERITMIMARRQGVEL